MSSPPAAIDLFWGRVPELAFCRRLEAGLSPADRADAGLARMDADRAALLFSRALLRVVLDRALGHRSWRLVRGHAGKPWLAGEDAGDLHFSLSRRRGLVGLAISREAPLGFDLEEAAFAGDPMAMARDHFSVAEQTILAASASPEDRRERFLGLWTAKEAVIKATGQGFSADLGSFSVSLSPPGLLTDGPDGSPAAGWRLWRADLAGHRLAAAQWRRDRRPINVAMTELSGEAVLAARAATTI